MTPTHKKPDRRAHLELPHRDEYMASNERLMKEGVMPDTLKGLLRWYERVWWQEVPQTLHRRGVWTSDGQIVRGEPQGVGEDGTPKPGYQGPIWKREEIGSGSRMGSPGIGEEFRRFIEESPTAKDGHGYFERPLANAMHVLAFGTGRGNGRPLIARWLWLVARCGFDWKKAADVWKREHQYAEMLTWKGLELLWERYLQWDPARRREAA